MTKIIKSLSGVILLTTGWCAYKFILPMRKKKNKSHHPGNPEDYGTPVAPI